MSPESPSHRAPLIRRGDQAVIAALATLAFVLLVGNLVLSSRGPGRLEALDGAPKQSYSFKLDINAASWAEIAQLPSVGEVLARRIVEARNRQGRFRSLADLARVHGMGPTTLARIEPFLEPLN